MFATKTAAETRDRRWWTLVVLCLSVFLVVVDNTIVNTALPTLAEDLDAGTSQLQWIVDAYTLAVAGLLLMGGALGDRYGRHRLLAGGLAVLGLGPGSRRSPPTLLS
jgi:MFS family permease